MINNIKMNVEELVAEKYYMQQFNEGTGNPLDKIRSLSRSITYLSENPTEDSKSISKIFKYVNIPNRRIRDCQGDIIPAFADKFNCQTMDVTIKTVVDYLFANWSNNHKDKKTYIILRGILYQCTPGKKLTYKKTAKLIDEIIRKEMKKNA